MLCQEREKKKGVKSNWTNSSGGNDILKDLKYEEKKIMKLQSEKQSRMRLKQRGKSGMKGWKMILGTSGDAPRTPC